MSLDEHAPYFRYLISGDSGSGKTGALAELVRLGYQLRVMDTDRGLSILRHTLSSDERKRVDPIPLRSMFKVDGAGRTTPSAVIMRDALKALLEKWPTDKSNAARWGAGTILVLDTLTKLGRESYLWAQSREPNPRDGQWAWYRGAQGVIWDTLGHITAEGFETNVIVMSHLEEGKITKDGKSVPDGKLWAACECGPAILSKVPSFFDVWLKAEKRAGDRRVLMTKGESRMALKFPVPDAPKELPAEKSLGELLRLDGYTPPTAGG